MPDPIDARALPPTPLLLLVALSAKAQLGSPCWTVRNQRLGPAIRGLQAAGLVRAESVAERHVRLWITDAGRAAIDPDAPPDDSSSTAV